MNLSLPPRSPSRRHDVVENSSSLPTAKHKGRRKRPSIRIGELPLHEQAALTLPAPAPTGIARWLRNASALATAAALALMASAALAQPNCRNTGAFDSWLAAVKKEALSQGISPAAIAAASPYLVYDQRIINIDRGQKFFAQNFLEISDKMLAGGRIPNGIAQMKKHQALFAREMHDFGVPAAVITA